MEIENGLVSLCIVAATRSEDSVERWRMQRRTLGRMPFQLGEALFHRLLRRRLLHPSLLEAFKYCVETIDLRGESYVDAEWMAYFGAFLYLNSLNVADCHRINSSSLWPISGMPNLKELDVSRCSKVTDAALRHLLSIPTLEKLRIAETAVTANGVILLSSLLNISVLDLGGLPVTDMALSSLQVLTKLQHLDLWGSEISNKGVDALKSFLKLSFLNLAWTSVTELPNLSSLTCLNMSNCTIQSFLKGEGNKPPLEKLILSGTTCLEDSDVFSCIETSFLSYLDVSKSSLHKFGFLPRMNALEYLNLSSCLVADDSVGQIAYIGASLRYLDLSNTKVSSAGVGNLAGHVPHLERISLSSTATDDLVFFYLSMMPSLRSISLNDTCVKGLIQPEGTEQDCVPSLASLQSLRSLERLDLKMTQIVDAALHPLSTFPRLSHLYLKSGSLSDMSLDILSSVNNLTELGICDAVFTNNGLDSFNPPKKLKLLDMRGCWLLTEHVISSFCQKHPQIELKHEFVHVLQPARDGPNYLSPPHATTTRLKHGNKLPSSHYKFESNFIDQRLKYSREELLSLQLSSISLHRSSHDNGMTS